MDFKKLIVDVHDFPIKGIIFRDITPVLESNFSECVDAIKNLYDKHFWSDVEFIAGIESRGFIFAAALAYGLKKGFLPIRKKGKLPRSAGSVSFTLEYGVTEAEMNSGSGKVVVVDDIIATGGTIIACADLATQVGFEVVGLCALIDLNIKKDMSWRDIQTRSVIHY